MVNKSLTLEVTATRPALQFVYEQLIKRAEAYETNVINISNVMKGEIFVQNANYLRQIANQLDPIIDRVKKGDRICKVTGQYCLLTEGKL